MIITVLQSEVTLYVTWLLMNKIYKRREGTFVTVFITEYMFSLINNRFEHFKWFP